ncbi:MAG: TusE/DsrC/DsvC family sulfur relay protein [Gammaproteobacteria bacterium]|nr:TusE/DsrC/DsvC family sulfur relay protein [Gammaproteobacteria bacterium]
MANQEKTGVLRDTEGYLVNPEDWSKSIAHDLAAEEDIEIDDDYWVALNFMRDYFNEHNIAPNIRHLMTYLAATYQCDKKAAKKRIFELFPYGYVKQACKIAGMKRPRAWSTG